MEAPDRVDLQKAIAMMQTSTNFILVTHHVGNTPETNITSNIPGEIIRQVFVSCVEQLDEASTVTDSLLDQLGFTQRDH